MRNQVNASALWWCCRMVQFLPGNQVTCTLLSAFQTIPCSLKDHLVSAFPWPIAQLHLAFFCSTSFLWNPVLRFLKSWPSVQPPQFPIIVLVRRCSHKAHRFGGVNTHGVAAALEEWCRYSHQPRCRRCSPSDGVTRRLSAHRSPPAIGRS